MGVLLQVHDDFTRNGTMQRVISNQHQNLCYRDMIDTKGIVLFFNMFKSYHESPFTFRWNKNMEFKYIEFDKNYHPNLN